VANRQELRDLKKYKQKLFGDIVLGLADSKEKTKTKKRINELEEEFEDHRLPRLYRRGTHLNRLLSVPVYREFALIPTLTDGEFPPN